MKTVLVIDDSSLLLQTIALLLKGAGYEVVLVSEPGRALSLCSDVNFDIVLCDICLSNSNETGFSSGMDLIWQIRDKFPKIPVIAMSGYVGQADLSKMKKLGVVGAIQKPFDADRLIEELGMVVNSQ